MVRMMLLLPPLLLALAGCGQKGPLYFPKPDQPGQHDTRQGTDSDDELH